MIHGNSFKQFATPTVRYLIIINVAIFILANLGNQAEYFASYYGALHSYQSVAFYPWQFVTYMFLHADIMHIFGNMFALYMFGAWLEKVWGAKRFIFFYFFTGIGAALIFWGVNTYQISNLKTEAEQFVNKPTPEMAIKFVRENTPPAYFASEQENLSRYQDNPENPQFISYFSEQIAGIYWSHANSPMVGASGAIFGILIAFALLFPNTELMLLFIPFPIKAKYFVLLYGLYEVYMQFRNAPDDNVAHLAHISGAVFGFILVKYWQKQRNSFY